MRLLLSYLLGSIFFFLAFSMESPGMKKINLYIAIGLFIWGYIEWVIDENRRDAENNRKTKELLTRIPHTQNIVSSEYLNALLLDENSNSLYVAKKEKIDSDFDVKKCQFNQLYEVAIVEDKNIFSLISRGGWNGGSLLDKEASSVVCVVNSDEDSGDEESDEMVSKLSLKMVIDNLSNPIVEYIFMEKEEPLSKESDEYKEVLKLCNQWHQKLSVIIKRYEYEKMTNPHSYRYL